MRVVVLTGAGERAFCAGADMKAARRTRPASSTGRRPRPGGFGGIALRETLDVPVIARVNGYALGGGFEMVLGCDIVVAAENAQLRPARAAGRAAAARRRHALLQRRIPHRLAMGMLLTGRRVPAAEALRLGLVNEVVPRAELDAAVERWVHESSPARRCRSGHQADGAQRSRLTAREAPGTAAAGAGRGAAVEDQDEGVRAFQEKREPEWQGRGSMAYVITPPASTSRTAICRRLPGRLHLRGRAHDVHPSGRMHQLRPVRVGLPGTGDLRRGRRAGRTKQAFIGDQREFFGADVTGWGSPGGVTSDHVSTLDVPLVKGFRATKS